LASDTNSSKRSITSRLPTPPKLRQSARGSSRRLAGF
jgi:hypothetical protein